MTDDVNILFKIDEILRLATCQQLMYNNQLYDVMWRGDDVFCVIMEIVIQDYEESQG